MGMVEKKKELPLSQPEDEWGEVLDNFELLLRQDPTLQRAFDRVTCNSDRVQVHLGNM